MFYTVYRITNLLNRKYYIGKHQTNNLNDGYFGSGKLIKRAIAKYGKENFSKEILFIFDNEDEMNSKEKELVSLSEDSYNLCKGGYGSFSHLNDGSLEHIERTRRGYKKSIVSMINSEKSRRNGLENLKKGLGLFGLNEEQKRINASNAFRGRKHSMETKTKISLINSINQSGNKNSQYGTCWITNGSLNKKIKKEEFDYWSKLGYNKGRIKH